MDRRKFTLLTSLVGLSLATKMPIYAKSLKNRPKGYKLNYAPHLGMFENSAGNDPIDQINFMADNGFNAFEDKSLTKKLEFLNFHSNEETVPHSEIFPI